MQPYRAPARPINDGSYEIELSGTHFTQTAIFDIEGNEVEQLEGNAFSQSDFHLFGRYGYGPRLQLFAGLSFRQNSSTNGITGQELSASGVESFRGGVHYSFDPVGRWRYAAEFSYAKTAYTNEFYQSTQVLPTDEIVLGDDGQIVDAILHVSFLRTRTNSYSFSGGVRMPQEHLAMELPWRFEAAWIFDQWALLGGVSGISSFGDDEFTENPGAKPRLPTGVTALYNSVNREKMEPFIGLNRAFSNWRLGVQYSQVISGISTDKGQQIGLNLSWSSSGTTAADKRLNTFKEYDNEASVTKVSPRGTFVRIDKGLTSDVDKGMRFDIFKTDYEGGNIMYATGTVYEVGSDWAIVRLTQTYRSERIQEGFTARGYRQ